MHSILLGILWVALLPSTCSMLPKDRASKISRNGYRLMKKQIHPLKCLWETKWTYIAPLKIQFQRLRPLLSRKSMGWSIFKPVRLEILR